MTAKPRGTPDTATDPDAHLRPQVAVQCPHCTKQLLKIPEACEYLGISTSKGYDLMHAGQFPVSVRKIGSQWRISKAELDEWLRNPQPPPGSGDLARLRTV
jgi:excisionase family DNA binding protein